MVDVANLLDERTLGSTEVEVGHLTVQELARDAPDGDDGHIGLFCLSSQLFGSELLFSGQCTWQELYQHGILRVFLSHFL